MCLAPVLCILTGYRPEHVLVHAERRKAPFVWEGNEKLSFSCQIREEIFLQGRYAIQADRKLLTMAFSIVKICVTFRINLLLPFSWSTNKQNNKPARIFRLKTILDAFHMILSLKYLPSSLVFLSKCYWKCGLVNG